MRAPLFWYERAGWIAGALAPLSTIFALATEKRLASGPRHRLGIPVICVGNINVGGTGKTPSVIALADHLRAKGLTPHAVTRGYGGSEQGPHRVDEARDKPETVGDEALLLAAFLPTWVAKDRAAGAERARAAGADVILLDDGFQNGALHHDLSIIIVDAWRGFGNGKVLPAGPLREPIERGMERADLMISIGPETAQARFDKAWGEVVTIPKITAQLEPLPTGLPLKGLRAIAFAGIGHPEKFFQTLQDLGVDLLATHPLADHQPLSTALMTRLFREARQTGAQVITTEKDAVRLSPEQRRQVLTLPVRLKLNEPDALEASLAQLSGNEIS